MSGGESVGAGVGSRLVVLVCATALVSMVRADEVRRAGDGQMTPSGLAGGGDGGLVSRSEH